MSDERRFADEAELERLAAKNSETMRESAPVAKPDSDEEFFRRAKNGLKASIAKSKNRDTVLLPAASENIGRPVRLQVRRMTIQEIAASYAFPARADKLVSRMVEMGAVAAQEADHEYNVEIPSPRSVVEGIYGGMTREAVAALFEFQAMVCCACVVDPGTRLFYTPEEVELADKQNPGRDNVLVWDVEDEDVNAIFDWVFEQNDRAEEQVLPFRGASETGGAVRVEQEPRGEATRAGDI